MPGRVRVKTVVMSIVPTFRVPCHKQLINGFPSIIRFYPHHTTSSSCKKSLTSRTQKRIPVLPNMPTNGTTRHILHSTEVLPYQSAGCTYPKLSPTKKTNTASTKPATTTGTLITAIVDTLSTFLVFAVPHLHPFYHFHTLIGRLRITTRTQTHMVMVVTSMRSMIEHRHSSRTQNARQSSKYAFAPAKSTTLGVATSVASFERSRAEKTGLRAIPCTASRARSHMMEKSMFSSANGSSSTRTSSASSKYLRASLPQYGSIITNSNRSCSSSIDTHLSVQICVTYPYKSRVS